MALPKTIKLISKGKVEQSFDFAHALRLLRYEKSTGKDNWSINNKGYEFKENEIIRCTRNTKKAEE